MGAAAAALPAVVVLTGSTGTGKSDLAIELVQRLPLEIISVDSALVYRGMDIGTAKPPGAVLARVPHHLIDIRDPARSYSAGEFVRDALAAIATIHARGRVPLLVGGTMLYLRALLDGMATLPQASPPVRAALDARAAAEGWAALHAQLAAIDPAASARIHPQDSQRIQRALEVFELTGRPISQWQRQTRGARGRFHWLRYVLMPGSRADLRQRLAMRFEHMMAAGLLQEVQALYARGDLTERHASIRAVGYRQLWEHCAGRATLAEATQRAITATAQLAKRQLTWLRSDAPGMTAAAARVVRGADAGAVVDAGRTMAARVPAGGARVEDLTARDTRAGDAGEPRAPPVWLDADATDLAAVIAADIEERLND